MKANLLLLAPIALLTCLLTAGCNRHSDQPTDQRLVPEYDIAACKVPKTAGETAVFASLEMSSSDGPGVSPYFDKKYDRALLGGVLRASALSTGDYVGRLLQGRLFRIQREYRPGVKVCPNFAGLPEAPPELRDFWQKNTGKINDPGAVLSGLYVEACYQGEFCDGKDITRPTILLDEGGDRWTLVHEMMHHNFNLVRKRGSGFVGRETLLRQAQFSRDTAEQNYNAYKINKSEASLAKVEEQANWLATVFAREILIRGPYEETAVEGTLLEEFLNGNLQYVATESAANALWYMSRSLQAGLELYAQPLSVAGEDHRGFDLSINDLHAFIRDEAEANGWDDLARKVQADRDAIEKLYEDAQKKIIEQNVRFQMLYPDQARRGTHFEFSNPFARGASLSVDAPIQLDEHLEASEGVRLFREFQKRTR